MSKLVVVVALAAVSALGACKKTGEGEYKVKGPEVEKQGDTIRIDTRSATVRTPSVDVGTKKDTLVVDRPTVDVKTPGERKDSAQKKRP